MNKITKEVAIKLIKENKNKIFNVSYVKKDNTLRDMTCMLGVKKHLKGGEKSYDTAEFPEYLIAFDMQKKGYRTINLDTMQSLKLEGNEYRIL